MALVFCLGSGPSGRPVMMSPFTWIHVNFTHAREKMDFGIHLKKVISYAILPLGGDSEITVTCAEPIPPGFIDYTTKLQQVKDKNGRWVWQEIVMYDSRYQPFPITNCVKLTKRVFSGFPPQLESFREFRQVEPSHRLVERANGMYP